MPSMRIATAKSCMPQCMLAVCMLLRTPQLPVFPPFMSSYVQALAKIKAKHAEEKFTLTLPEYEQILEALMGSHHQNVPSHYSVGNHDELGQILLAVRG